MTEPTVPTPAPPPSGTPAPAASPPSPSTPAVPAPPAADDGKARSGPAADNGVAAAELPPGLWDRMKADPQYAPEHLALEAVRRLGPEAQAWAAGQRAMRPNVAPDELADQAVRRFVNLARISGAVSGAVGLPGAIVDVGVLAWNQARMVLHIAAAYGVDPTHGDRATDLLVLQRIHKAAETARLALGVAAGRERAGALFARATRTPLGRALLRLGVQLAKMAGIRAARRVFAKVIPGAAVVLGTWANSSATKDLARRTIALYRRPALAGPAQD